MKNKRCPLCKEHKRKGTLVYDKWRSTKTKNVYKCDNTDCTVIKEIPKELDNASP